MKKSILIISAICILGFLGYWGVTMYQFAEGVIQDTHRLEKLNQEKKTNNALILYEYDNEVNDLVIMKKEIAKQYIEFLSKGDADGVISLFAENGKVHSPIYGEKEANDFYKTLAEDTLHSELKLNEIFENTNSGNIALYFEYTWTVKSGKVVVFDVVDVIEFDKQNKILKLKIIYDTVVSRTLIEELKNKPTDKNQ